MDRLTKDFRLSEFITPADLQSLRDSEEDNSQVFLSLQALATAVLQPIRDEINAPITVTSGYRSPEHNAEVGGAADSQHLKGEAADITSPQGILCIVEAVRSLGIDIDQMIVYPTQGFVHVSHKRTGRNRGQILWHRTSLSREEYSKVWKV